jgi:hypothetical protein
MYIIDIKAYPNNVISIFALKMMFYLPKLIL